KRPCEKCEAAAAMSDRRLCSEIAKKPCGELWDSNHKGSLLIPGDGKIETGTSSKSVLSKAYLMSIKDLIGSKDRLPADLRKEGGKILDDIDQTLKEEKNDQNWYYKLATQINNWNDLTDKVYKERVEAKYPGIKNKNP